MGHPIFGPQVRWGTPFLADFWTQFGANLAPSWATLVQELVLDGLVGLREAQRNYRIACSEEHLDPPNHSSYVERKLPEARQIWTETEN